LQWAIDTLFFANDTFSNVSSHCTSDVSSLHDSNASTRYIPDVPSLRDSEREYMLVHIWIIHRSLLLCSTDLHLILQRVHFMQRWGMQFADANQCTDPS
jgi:hypothetical protein